MNFSKTKYCAFKQCPKMCWLNEYKPQLCVTDEAEENRMNVGKEVGRLARNLFGDFTLVEELKDGKPNLNAMADRTKELIEKGESVICEASFLYDGLYCAVDILRLENGGYAIYEVKSSTYVKDIHLLDVAYQKYVLTKCGLNIVGIYVVHINSDYILQGEIDPKKLFKIEDVSKAISEMPGSIENDLMAAEIVLNGNEPNEPLSEHCSHPNECGYWEYCSKALPKPNVFDLYGVRKKWDLYGKGIVSFTDLLTSGIRLSAIQSRQIDHALNDREAYVNKDGIKEFLNTLSYPLYFLDFETMQSAVPKYQGTWPYQQIPFQYSLHYIEKEGGEVRHKEFLAQPESDPRRLIAERLCNDIPNGVCVLAYNKAFEGMIIKKLADTFPDLAQHLLGIKNELKDLLDPFKNGYYYNKEMGGSFSIKSVLPAVFPDDPSLNYENLDGVHNGVEAMNIFPLMASMSGERREKVRTQLLAYCGLDTLAMVMLYKKLLESIE